jgi:hypothetical protein
MNYEELARKHNERIDAKRKIAKDILGEYAGYNDSIIDRLLNGVAEKSAGLRATIDKLQKDTKWDNKPVKDWDKEQKNLKERSRNYSTVNDSVDLSGGIGNTLMYAPELMMSATPQGHIAKRMIKDGLKFGLGAYGLEKAYNGTDEEAMMSAIGAGGIGSLSQLFRKADNIVDASNSNSKSGNNNTNNSSSKSNTKSNNSGSKQLVPVENETIPLEVIEDMLRLRSVSHEFDQGTKKLPNPQNKIENTKKLAEILYLPQ